MIRKSHNSKKIEVVNLKETVTKEMMKDRFGSQHKYDMEYSNADNEIYKTKNFTYWSRQIKEQFIYKVDPNAFWLLTIPMKNFKDRECTKNIYKRNDFQSERRFVKVLLNDKKKGLELIDKYHEKKIFEVVTSKLFLTS